MHSFTDGKVGAKLETKYQWGESSAAGNNRKEIPGTDAICWKNARAMCYLKFIVSARNTPNEEHYQIKGAKLIIKDIRSQFGVDSMGFGMQEEFNGVRAVAVAQGEIWSGSQNAWGYGYLHLYVNKTTRPSIADAFLVEKRNAGRENFWSDQNVYGQKDPKSKEQFISKFRTWTTKWSDESIFWWKMYIAQTKVVRHTVIYSEKVVTPGVVNNIDSLTLENLGSKLTADTFAKIGSKETFTLETSTSMETTFDFSIDVGSSVSLEVGFVAASVEVNLHAGHSSTEASSSTKTTARETTIEWPTECPDGIRLTYTLQKATNKQTVPIEFTFERIGVQWQERKTFEATVNDIKQVLTHCCLVATASEQCGSENLRMC